MSMTMIMGYKLFEEKNIKGDVEQISHFQTEL